MAPVIIAKDLYKRYPGFPPVLKGVNISVEPGELVAIMGPSGCGKSTMLHVLGMLHAPDSGTLEILGTDVLAFDREQTAAFRRGNMGFVMQSSNLFDHSTVFENVEFPLIYEKVPPEERWERVIRALELVRLSARVHYRSNRLSGGEQQRVAIARAMVNNPRVLLADEPTGALDARTSRVVMENFRTLCHSGGVAMIMVTHDPSMADFCDSVYTLDDGILNCRKHDLSFKEHGHAQAGHLLDGPPRHMRAACVMGRFPEPTGMAAAQDILRLHAAGVLFRIYSTHGAGLAALGGSEQYALPLPVRRVGWLHSFRALAALMSGGREFRTSAGTLWHELPLRREPGALLSRLANLACGALLARWAREDDLELLYAPSAHGPATAAWTASRMSGIPFAFGVRTQDTRRSTVSLGIKMRDALFVRCDTEATRTFLREQFPDIPEEKLVLLRDGLTLPPPAEDEATMPAAPDAPRVTTILAAGALRPEKGYADLLRACAALKALNIPFALRIAGPGSSLRLRWLAWRLGLRRQVSFPGHVPHERMPEEYRGADIFVAPGYAAGHMDGLPSALQEAMLSGCAIVATDMPGQAEIIRSGRNGLLVPQRQPEALAKALQRLMEDPETARTLGRQAQEDARTLFDSDTDAPALVRLFLSARGTAEKMTPPQKNS